eukprot:4988209-Pyramimonas_sp.AAC.1
MNDTIEYMGDDDAPFVAGGLPDDVVLEGDEAIAVYAKYSQVRQHHRMRKHGRSFFKQQPPEGTSTGSR